MLGGHINWPWGKAVCQSKLRLKRAGLAKAMSEPSYKIAMESQPCVARSTKRGASLT